jgi:uncharacterized repeat protein (TIGR04052 family)
LVAAFARDLTDRVTVDHDFQEVDMRIKGSVALCVALGLTASAAGPAFAAGRTQPVDIRFAAVAGAARVACGQPIEGLGTTAQTAQLADLRFYVSDVKLVRADGRAVALKLARNSSYRVTRSGESVTLIDLEDGSGSCVEGTKGLNAVVRGTVPRGRYVGVRWSVGVPFALNHTDVAAAPAPLNSAAMGWSWQVGRKFTKIEVADPGGETGSWAAKVFMVHLGSTGCTGNPASGETVECANPNRGAVRLKRFDSRRQQVAVDVKALAAGTDITVNQAGAPGCMSGPTDPECGGVFRAFGIGWKADGTGDGASPAGSQSVFRAIGR